MEEQHKYKLGIIGNCSYLAYINDQANVVWHCWPYFDSSFIFGGLLDPDKGGQFQIAPTGNYTSKQYYLDNTNVLVTEFHAEKGRFRVLDFAPRFELFERYHRPLMLFRKIERISGHPSIKVTCRPKGCYGELNTKQQLGSNHIQFSGLEESIRLTTDISKVFISKEKPFVLDKDKYLILSYGGPFEAPLESTFEEFLRKTIHYWRLWVERSNVPSIFQNEVVRSALILKLHQFEDTGAFIASGTTSLPEHPGSGRNWDYRYCWIRDSYFTLSALHSLGHFSEAQRYSHYIQNLAENEEKRFQPVYKIDGEKVISETIINLQGYQGHGPVRIGNLAYRQIQNDVYGQIILSLLPLYTDTRAVELQSPPPINLIEKLLDLMEDHFDHPDSGIWEFRNSMYHHCETYLFHWAGLKAAYKIAHTYKHKHIKHRCNMLLKRAHVGIEACYRKHLKGFSMAKELDSLNASELLLITMNYLPANDKKTHEHLKALEKDLRVKDFLFYRYRKEDDFGETKSTFLICAFWYAEALACVGRIDDALRVIEGINGVSNHLGIFSEDICPNDFSQWGNFGQTYSHVGLINAVFRINSKLDLLPFEMGPT